jgi:hypothetical protein
MDESNLWNVSDTGVQPVLYVNSTNPLFPNISWTVIKFCTSVFVECCNIELFQNFRDFLKLHNWFVNTFVFKMIYDDREIMHAFSRIATHCVLEKLRLLGI